ncbi:MAG: hypothetical protein HGA45_00920 [Chloroflexales bacterium]|nr:hypothetical protein [Chloroflexales bacterium]
MKFFLFFLTSCLIIGMLTSKVSTSRLTWMLAGFSIAVMIGYFFLDMI